MTYRRLLVGLVVFTFLATMLSIAMSPPAQADADKVTLCHATGSASNPYSVVTVPKKQVIKGAGHGGHPNDVIPAFEGYAGQNAALFPACTLPPKVTPTEEPTEEPTVPPVLPTEEPVLPLEPTLEPEPTVEPTSEPTETPISGVVTHPPTQAAPKPAKTPVRPLAPAPAPVPHTHGHTHPPTAAPAVPVAAELPMTGPRETAIMAGIAGLMLLSGMGLTYAGRRKW